MKVLHVAETLPGGPASYLEEVLDYQARTFGSANMHLLAAESHLAYVPKGFQGRVTTFTRRRRSLRSLISLGIQFHKIMSESIPPDIIHLHSSLAGAVCRLVLFPMRIRSKVVYCAHCWFFDRPQNNWLTKVAAHVEKRLAKHTDAIINVSPHETTLLLRHGFALNNVVTVVSGIHDSAKADPPTKEVGLPMSPIRLLFIGRFDEQKGLDLLMEAVRRLDPEKVAVTIVGKPVVGTRDDDAGFPGNARFIGWQRREEIPALIRSHHFVVLPSRWEGLPLTALESFREGRPIIGNRIPALAALLDANPPANRAGLLLDLEDPNALHAALQGFDEMQWRRLCQNARATYLDRYKSEDMNFKVVEIYRRLFAQDAKTGLVRVNSRSIDPGHS